MRKFITKFNTKKTFALGLSVVIAATSVMGCSKPEDDDDDDDDSKAKSKIEKTIDDALTTQYADLSFVDTLKEAEAIKGGEATGTFSVDTVTSGKYEFAYTLSSDGQNGAEFVLTDKADTSTKLLDLIVYDYKVYFDAYKLIEKYAGADLAGQMPQGFMSIDLKKIMEQSGVDINAQISDADKQEAVTMSNEILDTFVKDFPSVFGDDVVINADNADKVVDEFIVFVTSGDFKNILEKYKAYFNKVSPEVAKIFENMDTSELDNAKAEDVSDEEKQEMIDALKKIDFKMTDSLEGAEGSRVLTLTCDFKFNNPGNQLDGLSVNFDTTLEEKTVDIASIVPTGAADFTDMLAGSMGSLGQIEDEFETEFSEFDS